MIILLDANFLGGGIGVFLGVVFFLLFAAIAFVAYKLLRKTMKMAFRIAVVVILLGVAVAGSAYFLLAGTAKSVRPGPRPTANSK